MGSHLRCQYRSPEYGDQEASSRFSRMPRRDEPSHRHSRQRRAGKSNSEKRHSEKNTSPRSPSQAEDEAPSTPHRYRETDDGDAVNSTPRCLVITAVFAPSFIAM